MGDAKMIFWLGPWVWDTKGALPPHWRAPDGSLSSIDLRPLPAQALRGAIAGVGLFGTDEAVDLGSDYRAIGRGAKSIDVIPKESDRKIFESMIGISGVLGTTLSEWLWTTLSLCADPTGDSGPRPLMPTTHRHLELIHNGELVRVPFRLGMAEAAAAIAVMQEDYRAIRRATLDGKTTHAHLHRKVLGFWGEKFGVNNPEDIFIPARLPKEKPLKPTTTITDSFNRANSTVLGTSSEGWSWTELVSSIDIVSNAAQTQGASTLHSARAETDLSSSDNYAEIVISVLPSLNHLGAGARFSSSADTYYRSQVYTGDNKQYLDKVVAGTETHLGTAVSVTPSIPEAYRTSANGSTIKGYQAGVERRSETDTSITSGTRTGMGGYNSGTSADSFTAADLAAAGAIVGKVFQATQAVNRAATY